MKKILLGIVLGTLIGTAVAQLEIKTETTTIDNRSISGYFNLQSGQSVSISITGIGTRTFTVPAGKTAGVSIDIVARLK